MKTRTVILSQAEQATVLTALRYYSYRLQSKARSRPYAGPDYAKARVDIRKEAQNADALANRITGTPDREEPQTTVT